MTAVHALPGCNPPASRDTKCPFVSSMSFVCPAARVLAVRTVNFDVPMSVSRFVFPGSACSANRFAGLNGDESLGFLPLYSYQEFWIWGVKKWWVIPTLCLYRFISTTWLLKFQAMPVPKYLYWKFWIGDVRSYPLFVCTLPKKSNEPNSK